MNALPRISQRRRSSDSANVSSCPSIAAMRAGQCADVRWGMAGSYRSSLAPRGNGGWLLLAAKVTPLTTCVARLFSKFGNRLQIAETYCAAHRFQSTFV